MNPTQLNSPSWNNAKINKISLHKHENSLLLAKSFTNTDKIYSTKRKTNTSVKTHKNKEPFLDIKLKLNQKNFEKDLEELINIVCNRKTMEEYDNIMVIGHLFSIISKNTSICIAGIENKKREKILKSIAMHVFERTIEVNAINGELLVKIGNCLSIHTLGKTKIIKSTLERMAEKMEKMKYFEEVENTLKKWYVSVLEIEDLDIDAYFNLTKSTLDHRIFSPLFTAPKLKEDLDSIVQEFSTHSDDEALGTIDLFKKNKEGVYNIDNALSLLQWYKTERLDYFKKNRIPDRDIHLLRSLHKNWEEIAEFFTEIEDFIDENGHHINLDYLTKNTLNRESSLLFRDPRKCKHSFCIDIEEIENIWKSKKYRPEVVGYITYQIMQIGTLLGLSFKEIKRESAQYKSLIRQLHRSDQEVEDHYKIKESPKQKSVETLQKLNVTIVDGMDVSKPVIIDIEEEFSSEEEKKDSSAFSPKKQIATLITAALLVTGFSIVYINAFGGKKEEGLDR